MAVLDDILAEMQRQTALLEDIKDSVSSQAEGGVGAAGAAGRGAGGTAQAGGSLSKQAKDLSSAFSSSAGLIGGIAGTIGRFGGREAAASFASGGSDQAIFGSGLRGFARGLESLDPIGGLFIPRQVSQSLSAEERAIQEVLGQENPLIAAGGAPDVEGAAAQVRRRQQVFQRQSTFEDQLRKAITGDPNNQTTKDLEGAFDVLTEAAKKTANTLDLISAAFGGYGALSTAAVRAASR